MLLTHLFDTWLPTPLIPGCGAGPACLGRVGILSTWFRWDAGFFEGIAYKGYAHVTYTSFYPGYPILLRAGSLLLGERALSVMVVTSLCALAAFLAIGWLAATEIGPSAGRLALLALAAYPFTFFTYAPYSESLELAFVALALLGARRRWWWLAALGSFGAVVTRLTGALVSVVVLWELVRAYRETPQLRPRPREIAAQAAALLAGPVGFLSFLGFLWLKFGDPLIGLKTERTDWGRGLTNPISTARSVIEYLPTVLHGTQVGTVFGVDLVALLLFVIVPIALWRKLPPSLTVYSLLVVLASILAAAPGGVPGGTDPLISDGRYLLVSIPVFLGLGLLIDRRPALVALLPIGFLLQGAFAVMYMNWNWVG